MKKRLPLLFLILQSLLLVLQVNGQTPFCNIGGGGFNVTPAVGCVGEKVIVENTVAQAANLGYNFQFDRKQTTAPASTDLSDKTDFVYTSAGTYTILQVASSNAQLVTSCRDLQVRETRPVRGTLISCGNNVVQLIVYNDNFSKAYDWIYIDWGDQQERWTMPIGKNLVVPHAYQSNAVPSVTIKGLFDDKACATSTGTTTISSYSTPPSLAGIRIRSIEMTANGTAKIIYDGMDDIVTQVWVAEGNGAFANSQKGTSSGGAQTVVVENLDPAKTYRFELRSRNACGDLEESNVVSSVTLRALPTIADEVNSLAWDAYSDPSKLIQYQLVRDSNVIHSTDQLSYLDNTVKCGQQYSYVLAAIIENDVRSYSAPVQAEPHSSAPETITNAMVTVNGDNEIETKVTLGGEGLTSTYDIEIERAVGNGAWALVSPLQNNSLIYKDQNVNTSENSYCYRFRYTNACNLSSPAFSEKVCSILLTGKGTALNWTSETPFTGGVGSYDVLGMDNQGNVTAEISSGLQVAYDVGLDNDNTNVFQVRAYSGTGSLVSVSNKLLFTRDAILLIPDIFTPNHDPHNDVFEIKSRFIDAFSLSVFSRWGTLVFHTTDPAKGWDGYIDGKPAVAGYYIYKIEAKDLRGKNIKRQGEFLLLRGY